MTEHNGSWRSTELGPAKELQLPQGTLRYHDAGSGPAIVFVHGVLVNANVWRKVVAALAPDFRCIALDLPFGAHEVPMPLEADLSPPAVADLIADAIEKLDLNEVTLVGNDTGGAFCQLVITRRPERIGRLVLTSCDAFEDFPPKALKPLMPILRLPGALAAMFAPLRLKAVRRRALTMMRVTKRPVEPEVADSYALPGLRSSAVRRDARKLLAAVDKRYTLEAAERFKDFDRPALIAFSSEDRFFPQRDARRLAEQLPQARLEWIEDSYTFSPEDQPGRLAGLIREFQGQPASAPPPNAREGRSLQH
jgi:pimeloyl-ACP methyl ester carboxylesterase